MTTMMHLENLAIPELNESLVDSTKSTKRKQIGTSDKANNSKRKTITSNVSADGNSRDDNSQSTESMEINGLESEIEDLTPHENPLQIKIITIPHIQALSSYAQHVRNNKEVYINMPAVNRENLFNEVVLAKLEDDHFVCLKYNRTGPANGKNEYQQSEHDEAESERVLGKKKSLENGILKFEDVTDDLEPDVILNEEEIKFMLELDLVNRKKAKLKVLRRESTFIGLDAKIKGSLGLDKADPKNALEHLSKMAEMNIEPLMLKKHPHIVDMSRRLTRYIGNVKEWGMNEEQQEQFGTEAKNVREKAEEVYVNFAKLFGITDICEFWDIFCREVEIFNGHIIDLEEREMFTMTAEPNSREAFIEKLDDEKFEVGKLDEINSCSEETR